MVMIVCEGVSLAFLVRDGRHDQGPNSNCDTTSIILSRVCLTSSLSSTKNVYFVFRIDTDLFSSFMIYQSRSLMASMMTEVSWNFYLYNITILSGGSRTSLLFRRPVNKSGGSRMSLLLRKTRRVTIKRSKHHLPNQISISEIILCLEDRLNQHSNGSSTMMTWNSSRNPTEEKFKRGLCLLNQT